jgi:hypothetical protein
MPGGHSVFLNLEANGSGTFVGLVPAFRFNLLFCYPERPEVSGKGLSKKQKDFHFNRG